MANENPYPILAVRNLKKYFPVRSGLLLRHTGNVYAVDDVSFAVQPGETVGLVGESGCGKSTVARTVVRIYRPTDGTITFQNENIAKLRGEKLQQFRKHATMVFQDPFSSLNPRQTIAKILDTPLRVHRFGSTQDRKNRVVQLLERVGLGAWAQNRYPHEFSGGQRQRLAIARAIALDPKLVVADEPVSALDVSVQSQILNLLRDLQQEKQMAYLFIAHNLAVVKHVSHRIVVMYLGKVVETTNRDDLFRKPLHPYTQALIKAHPVPGAGRKRKRDLLTGDVASPLNPPPGCRFNTRCPLAEKVCREVEPELINYGSVSTPHWAACHMIQSKGEA